MYYIVICNVHNAYIQRDINLCLYSIVIRTNISVKNS